MRNRLTRGQKALQEMKERKMREVFYEQMEELSKALSAFIGPNYQRPLACKIADMMEEGIIKQQNYK